MIERKEKMEQKKRKNDFILIAAVLAVSLVSFAGLRLYRGSHTKDAEAVVTIDGEEYGRFPLTQNVREKIELDDGSYNVLVIQDGEADVTEASCPDGICVNHKNISMQGESIVCLPNKLVVEIQNGEAADIDVIAN